MNSLGSFSICACTLLGMAVATAAAAERNSGSVAMLPAYSRISDFTTASIVGRALSMMASSLESMSSFGITGDS